MEPMREQSPLGAFLARASAGDGVERDRAYAELLRWVRIVVRAEMGRRLRDHRESADVCQSIARSFADDFEAGRVRFESERALTAYLRVAVRNKLAQLARMDGALKRGGGTGGVATLRGLEGAEPAAEEAAPGVLDDEARLGLLSGLSDEDRRLAELRMRGLAWETVAREMGLTVEAARQRFSRLSRRVRERLDAE